MRLDGVRILDLSHLLPGPYATQLLADAGADVVKVEPPSAGDFLRSYPPLDDDGVGRLFAAINRGKRSVAIDLKRDEGLALFHRLAAEADVVLEQFRPGVADRLGVGYDAVGEHNPDVVYCSLSGFGQTGPAADRVGHDLNYVGLAGLLDMTRSGPDEPPAIPGYPIADMAGGLFAAFAIVGALASRALGNASGEYLDVAMADVVASLAQPVLVDAMAGEDPRPGGTPLTGGDPWYAVYEAADGQFLTLAAFESKFWASFCEAIGRPELAPLHGTEDPDEREALREELATLFASRPRAEWLDRLADRETMVAPVHSPRELLADPQFAARGLFETGGGPPHVGLPVQSSDASSRRAASAPALGEHTDAVLCELGVDAGRLDDLRAVGVIG